MKKSEAIDKLTDFISFNTTNDSYDVVAKRVIDFLEKEIGMLPPRSDGLYGCDYNCPYEWEIEE